MIKEHALITLSAGKGECLCNPEILLGSTFGLWDQEYKMSPRGTLLDLNAAWELFFDRRTFMNDLRFETYEHHQMETIDGITYYNGDVTYTLLDDKGGKTNASFTIRGNSNLADSIEWQNGSLVIYYNKFRSESDSDRNSGYDMHYVTDNEGNIIIDNNGEKMIYNYVAIPLFDIFDQDEMHKLFPWFADDQHTVRLRQNLDNPNNTTEGHLGDFAITNESEVFIAKERYSENSGNILISLQSLIDQLKRILGISLTYENAEDISDENSIHQRVTGSNISNVLTTQNKQSLLVAINEINSKLGNINNLSTTNKNNVVESINEIVSNFISSNLILGEIPGTAYEGSKGKQVADNLEQLQIDFNNHITDYNNPHRVTAQQLSVTINDPNNSQNVDLENTFNVEFNLLTALQELFTRLNITEDKASEIAKIFATPQELLQLDQLDQTLSNNNPTVVGIALEAYNKVNDIEPISNQRITEIINNYFL